MTDKILGSVLCKHCNNLHRSHIPCNCNESVKQRNKLLIEMIKKAKEVYDKNNIN
jgi:hypothetical protein